MITTFPQASLRSRRAGFPESGSDLGATPRSPSQEKRSLSVDPHTPRGLPVYFQGRFIFPRPYVLLVRLLLKPRIKGTRIPVSLVLGYLADGYSEEKIIAEFPDLTEQRIAACLDYARELADFEVDV